MGFGLSCLQLLVDNRLHVFHAAILKPSAVYEDRRRSSNPQADAFLVILAYPGCRGRTLLIFTKFCLIQAELVPDLLNFLVIELIVIFKKFIVKCPEFFLLLSCQSRHGGLNGIFMSSDGKIFENNSDVGRVFFEQLLELRHKLCTVRSLEITEDRDNDRCLRTTLRR